MSVVSKIKYNSRKRQFSCYIFIPRYDIPEKEWRKILEAANMVDTPSLQGLEFPVIMNVKEIK